MRLCPPAVVEPPAPTLSSGKPPGTCPPRWLSGLPLPQCNAGRGNHLEQNHLSGRAQRHFDRVPLRFTGSVTGMRIHSPTSLILPFPRRNKTQAETEIARIHHVIHLFNIIRIFRFAADKIIGPGFHAFPAANETKI